MSSIFVASSRKKAFDIASSHLLELFRRSFANDVPQTSLRMHIAGEGGARKSTMVQVVRYLSKSYGFNYAISTVAPTGKVSVLIEGENVHSKFYLFFKKKLTRTTFKSGQKYSRLSEMK